MNVNFSEERDSTGRVRIEKAAVQFQLNRRFFIFIQYDI
jgi:hypothetical protein